MIYKTVIMDVTWICLSQQVNMEKIGKCFEKMSPDQRVSLDIRFK